MGKALDYLMMVQGDFADSIHVRLEYWLIRKARLCLMESHGLWGIRQILGLRTANLSFNGLRA
jgi:hypothetical protein